MSNKYQKTPCRGSATAPEQAGMPVPETVSVAMAEIAGSVREGLLALAVSAGLQVMAAMMEEGVTALCGPKGKHDPDRIAVRHGSEAGSVVLGGRKVPVRRPRVRTADGTAEVPVPAYETFASADLLEQMALERMLASCPRAATGSASSRSASRPTSPRRARASRRSRGGSLPGLPRPWPS